MWAIGRNGRDDWIDWRRLRPGRNGRNDWIDWIWIDWRRLRPALLGRNVLFPYGLVC